MTHRNSTTHTILMIRVDTENRNSTKTNPAIRYRKDSRQSRLGCQLKKSHLTMSSRSSTPYPGNHGTCIAEQRGPWLGLTSLLKIGLLGVCGHGDTSRVVAFGHRCVRVASRACKRVVDADTYGNALQGSRPRCLCRFFCCTVFIVIFLVAAIVLTLALVRLLGRVSRLLSYSHSSGYDPQISSLELVTAL